MILRAIFWIGLVAVLMPHEPVIEFPSRESSLPGLAYPAKVYDESSVGDARIERYFDRSTLVSEWRDKIWDSVPRIRAELQQNLKDNGPREGLIQLLMGR